jgi:hypothetical protein
MRAIRRGSRIVLVERDEQHYGFDTVKEDLGCVRRPLAVHRPCAEDFVFAERFEGGGGDGGGVADGIEDLD